MDNSQRADGARSVTSMDDLILDHPVCPVDGVLLREVDAGWQCPECGRFESGMVGPLRPEYDGPALFGG